MRVESGIIRAVEITGGANIAVEYESTWKVQQLRSTLDTETCICMYSRPYMGKRKHIVVSSAVSGDMSYMYIILTFSETVRRFESSRVVLFSCPEFETQPRA